MKIISARVYALRLPFKTAFSHSLKTRTYSDSVVVRVTADTGATGFGEAAPRPYVTGETVESCCDHIQRVLLPALARHDFPQITAAADPMAVMAGICELLPENGQGAGIIMNAAKAAVELACIDCLLKDSALPFSALVKPQTDMVTYSSVITAGSIEAVRKAAQQSKQLGFQHVKMKVGMGDDIERIALVRNLLGDLVSIRVDANGAFDEHSALSFIGSLQPYRIEQPIPRGDVKALARLKARSEIPVMADESLVTQQDALELIGNDACDIFNLRISKNGGFCRTLQLAEMARKAGLGIQFGCQVGETAILSAAGRHIAAHYPDAKFVEGSFGTYLLEEDVAAEPVMFGFAGKVGLLHGLGLGIDIREDVLERYAEKTFDLAIT
jgi:muconate cycloisomerase